MSVPLFMIVHPATHPIQPKGNDSSKLDPATLKSNLVTNANYVCTTAQPVKPCEVIAERTFNGLSILLVISVIVIVGMVLFRKE